MLNIIIDGAEIYTSVYKVRDELYEYRNPEGRRYRLVATRKFEAEFNRGNLQEVKLTGFYDQQVFKLCEDLKLYNSNRRCKEELN